MEFNRGWIFINKDGEEVPVTLPHDAMLHEERDPKCRNGVNTGYYPGGRYHYRKRFTLTKEQVQKNVILFFEAVYQNSTVTINGHFVGGHKYGYSEFRTDITRRVSEGVNEVDVEADNSLEPNCRWYSGSGIFHPVHIFFEDENTPRNIRIRTLSYDPARVAILAEPEDCHVEITDPEGRTIMAGRPGVFTIEDACLWSAEGPALYRCRVLSPDRQQVREEAFGIRLLEWSAEKGLCVNGQRTLLRGGCIHHDNGMLGACDYQDASYRRIRILKEAGFNAIRSAHNPLSRSMLRACDELGMYVMDESFDGWYTPKNYHDYSRYFNAEWKGDLTAMVEKDRNHPCVIMYSVGNEVSETATDEGVLTCGRLREYVNSLDDSRPVTAGINVLLNVYTNMGLGVYKDKGEYKPEPLPPLEKSKAEKKSGSAFFNAMAQHLGGLMFWMSKGKKGDKAASGAAARLDIIGLNYAASRYDEDVIRYPKRMMVGSETMVTDLPYNWQRVQRYPAVVGDFVWAAWDYLGESGVGDWTYHSYPGLPLLAGSGVIDITGKITAEAYFEQVVWGLWRKPWIGVRPMNHSGETPDKSAWRFTDAIDSWNWQGYEGRIAVVEVYAAAAAVRVELRGITQTEKIHDFRAKFRIPYLPGELTAIALDSLGREIDRSSLKSGGRDTHLSVQPDRGEMPANGQSLCYIPIEFVDQMNQLKPLYEQPVRVTVTGAAELAGLGSARAKTDEEYTGDTFTSYRGRLMAVLRAGTRAGDAEVLVETEGFEPVRRIIHVI